MARGVPFKKGNCENPAGRPVGALSKFQLAQAKAAAVSGMTPLQFLLTMMRADPEELKKIGIKPTDATPDRRHNAATAAAPYVHRKMPIGIDNGNGGPVTFATPADLAKLSTADLKKLEEVMTKLAAITSPGLLMTAVAASQQSDTPE